VIAEFVSQSFGDTGPFLSNLGKVIPATIGYTMIQNLSKKRNLYYHLSFNPEAFDIDLRMGELMNQASFYERWNPEAYLKLGEDIDRMFQHEKSIRKRGPEFGDLAAIQTWIESIKVDLTGFREHILNANDIIGFQKVMQLIWAQIDKHYSNIYKKTRRLYPSLPQNPPALKPLDFATKK
jgi:hypothetical protein